MIIAYSAAAQADWVKTALIVSALDSGDSTVVKRDKYSEMISVIREKLPYKGRYASVDRMAFDIPKEDQEYYLSYFKNDGYQNVSIQDNKLVFDFKGHAAMRKKLDQEEEEAKSTFLKIAGFLSILLLILVSIKNYVEKTSNKLINFINQALIQKAKEKNEQAVTYTIRDLSFSEKWKFIQKYKEYLKKI